MLNLLPLATVRADGPNDQFVDDYTLIQQADALSQSGQTAAATEKYLKAQNGLKTLQGGFPEWNKDVVQFRLDYVTEKLSAMTKPMPTPAPVMKRTVSNAELEQQVSTLQAQTAQLTQENAGLTKKLKEALAVQPAAIDPQELTKAEARITALQKEKDLLTVSLDQEKAARLSAEKSGKIKKGPSDSEIAELKDKAKQTDVIAGERDALAKKLSDANKEISVLQSLHVEAPKPNASEVELARLKESNAVTEKKLAEAEKTLNELKTIHAESPKSNANDIEIARLKEANTATNKKLEETQRAFEALKSRPVEVPKSNDAEIAHLKEANAITEKKLAAAKHDLEVLQDSRREELRRSDEARTKEFNAERDELKKKLAAATKAMADAEASHDGRALAARNEEAQLKKVSSERDDLALKLKATEAEMAALKVSQSSAKKNQRDTASGSADLTKRNEQLQARLAVYEANPVPLTAEELALFKKPATKIAVHPPTVPAAAAGSHVVHSIKDLPPGAGALMADAQRAFQARDFEKAESKYREVLSQDDKNVYVLAHLANAQFAAGQIDDCEKTVRDVIALDPNDPAGLYLMGNLRMRQGKLDEALDALSRSSLINPTNSVTQNSLGTVLSQKGQRKAAETALRKALMSDPDYADAHHNLAIVYATENPPSMELARLHYKKAMDLGHPRDADLEKLIDEKK